MARMKRDGTPLRAAAEPGTNKRIVENALKSWTLPKVDVKDPEAIKERVIDYLNHCMQDDVPPSIAGCANWLGVNSHTLKCWYEGRYGSPEHQKVMTNFYATMEEIWAQDMHEGNVNPVAGIFMGKVFYGYKDTQELIIQQNNQDSSLSAADLIAESQMLPGGNKPMLTDDRNIPIEAEARVIEDDPEPQKETPKKKSGRKKQQKKKGCPIKYPETADMTQAERTRYNHRRKIAERNAERAKGINSLSYLQESEAQKERRKAQKGLSQNPGD